MADHDRILLAAMEKFETTDSVSQLTRTIDQIARGSQDQTSSIEQATLSVSQLNSSVTQVAATPRKGASAMTCSYGQLVVSS